MPNVAQLKLDPNVEYVITFLYDKCKEGTSDYGLWHRYAVRCNGEECGLFASDTLHEILQDYKKNDSVLLVKEKHGDDPVRWNVTPCDAASARHAVEAEGKQPQGSETESSDKPDQEYWESKDDLKAYLIARGQSWNLAFQHIRMLLTPEQVETLGGDSKMLEMINYWADRILVGLTDHYAGALVHVNTAKNLFHLNSIWKRYCRIWRRLLDQQDIDKLIEECSRLRATFEEKEEKPKSKKKPPDDTKEPPGEPPPGWPAAGEPGVTKEQQQSIL